MILDSNLRRCSLVLVWFAVTQDAFAQFPFPPPAYQVPMAVPVAYPAAIIIRNVEKPSTTTTTTTTTTTCATKMIAIPLPLPMPGPAFPVSFPLPRPILPQQPVIVFNENSFSSSNRESENSLGSEESSSSSSESNSDTSFSVKSSSISKKKKCQKSKREKKQLRKKNAKHGPRRFNSGTIESNESGALVRPVLTYLSNKGNIKYKSKISNKEARQLLGEDEPNIRLRSAKTRFSKVSHNGYDKTVKKTPRIAYPEDTKNLVQNVKLVTGDDGRNKMHIRIVSNDVQTNDELPSKNIKMLTGSRQQALHEGQKELIFRPPHAKRISNLSVSFMVS